MEKWRVKFGGCALLGLLLIVVGIAAAYYLSHDKNYKNEAISRGDSIILNGVRYEYGGPDEIYTISDIVICTTDNGEQLYEIEEYPEYEYIAVYSAWDGEIYKKVE